MILKPHNTSVTFAVVWATLLQLLRAITCICFMVNMDIQVFTMLQPTILFWNTMVNV